MKDISEKNSLYISKDSAFSGDLFDLVQENFRTFHISKTETYN